LLQLYNDEAIDRAASPRQKEAPVTAEVRIETLKIAQVWRIYTLETRSLLKIQQYVSQAIL
jgi:hypothetical protein